MKVRMNRRKTNWMHIQFWFKGPRWHGRLSLEEFAWFKAVLSIINLKCMEYVGKRFYLFEPNPHCFFAMELRNRESFRDVVRQVLFVQERYIGRESIIERIAFRRDTPDKDNKEGFIFVLDAMTTYNLIHSDNSVSHLIHCCLDNCGFPREKENLFYKFMAKHYR